MISVMASATVGAILEAVRERKLLMTMATRQFAGHFAFERRALQRRIAGLRLSDGDPYLPIIPIGVERWFNQLSHDFQREAAPVLNWEQKVKRPA
jgi:hypothetical protein